MTHALRIAFDKRKHIPECKCVLVEPLLWIDDTRCPVHETGVFIPIDWRKFMSYPEKLKAIVVVLKKRFNNLSAEELIDLATQILEVLEEK